MAIAWPPLLPQIFLVDGFQEVAPIALIRQPTDVGPAKMRPRYTRGQRRVSGGIAMTRVEVADFQTFYTEVLQGGALPFDMPDPRQPGYRRAFRILAVQYEPAAPDVWRVRLDLERAPEAGGPTVYAALVLAEGPTAYWRLGEPTGALALDATGHGFTGTYQASPVLNEPPAIVGGPPTVRFDGVSAWCDFIGTEATLGANGKSLLSVEMWIKTTYNQATERWVLDKPKNAFSAYAFSVLNNVLRFRVGQAPNAFLSVDATVPINDGVWHHVAGVKTATTLTVYVDGVARGATTFAPFTIEDNQGQTARLARHIGGDEFPGSLGDVALYLDRALAPASLAARYEAGVPRWPAALPSAFLLDGYREMPPTSVVVSSVPGLAQYRSRGEAGVTLIGASLAVTRDLVEVFDQFFVQTLAHGARPFIWTDPRTKAVRRFRFSKIPVYEPMR